MSSWPNFPPSHLLLRIQNHATSQICSPITQPHQHTKNNFICFILTCLSFLQLHHQSYIVYYFLKSCEMNEIYIYRTSLVLRRVKRLAEISESNLDKIPSSIFIIVCPFHGFISTLDFSEPN